MPGSCNGGERPALGQLLPQPWMAWPETQAVMDALQADGAEVRFVGGCVRDGLLGLSCADIDIATPNSPDIVVALLRRAGLRAIPTGARHGTITAILGQRSFEITSLREDVETDGRHATVRWASDWKTDATRRDFTINALSATRQGAVYDYCQGLEDLAARRVRFIGCAAARIGEDALRILRFFRFQGRFGRLPADTDALAACRHNAHLLDGLSAERIRGELLRILAHDSAVTMVDLMRGVRAWPRLPLPDTASIGRLRQVVFLETRAVVMDGLGPDPLRRLAVCLPQDGAQQAARCLQLSNADTRRLVAMLADGEPLAPGTGDDDLRRALFDRGRQGVLDRLLLRWADERADGARRHRAAPWIELLRSVLTMTTPQFPLRGRDITALGIPAGPQVGERLRAARQWWCAGGCRGSRLDMVNWLREAERQHRH